MWSEWLYGGIEGREEGEDCDVDVGVFFEYERVIG